MATDGSAPKDALGGAHVGVVAVAADDDRDHDGAGRLRLAMERGQERPLEAPQGIELASAFVGGTSRRRR